MEIEQLAAKVQEQFDVSGDWRDANVILALVEALDHDEWSLDWYRAYCGWGCVAKKTEGPEGKAYDLQGPHAWHESCIRAIAEAEGVTDD